MTEPLVLTLNIGTSSTRALLWDMEGREVEGVRAQIAYSMHTTADGGVEMPAEEFLKYVGDCLDQVMTQIGDRAASLRAVGLSTYWHSLLGLSKDGTPLTPIFSWADNRAADAALQLRSTLDAESIRLRTGCVLHPSYYPAKLTWLRATRPKVFAQVDRWVSPSEYLFRTLFGAEACQVSVSMASGTGLFNQTRCEWDAETLAALQLPVEKLSPIVDTKVNSQGLQGEYAQRWPALREVPFFPAVGDGACGNVGSGCATPTRFAINVGTSGAIRAMWEEVTGNPGSTSSPLAPAGFWRYRADASRPLIGTAFSDGGNVYLWLTRTLQLPSREEIESRIAAMQPGEHGLTFLPFLAGERGLGWHPDARASLVGMNLDTDPVEILRAALEAVAMRFALAAQRLQTAFPQAQEVIASGGALGQSPAWAQMFADAIGKPITLTEEPEASSRGAALLAMEVAGLIASASAPEARLGRTFAPNTEYHARYEGMLATQQELYGKLIEGNGKR